MKRVLQLLSLILLITLTTPELRAQDRGIRVSRVYYNFQEPTAKSHNFDLGKAWYNSKNAGFEFSYFQSIDEHASWAIPLKIGHTKLPISRSNIKDVTDRQILGNLDALFQYSILKHSRRLVPYVQFGIGSQYNFDTEKFQLQVPLGAGFNFRLVEGWYLSAQSEYRIAGKEEFIDGIVSTIGIIMDLGPRVKPDADGDGIPDKDDKCPSVPGIAAFQGCPDTDGDGITDADDKCPTVAGLPTFMGCPDTDNDGITDADDICPTEAGIVEFKGCPDTDGDGIADNEDKCPKEKGKKENMGCPEKDTDGDGITDKMDSCPTEKGTAAMKGCPDRDGDGVADKDDTCPDKKGEVKYKGCADTDGDGIADNEDRCPEVKGEAKNKGCPDSDKDGVVDMDDKCPEKPGPASNKGCPEMKVEEQKKLEFAMRAVQFESGKSTLLPASTTVLNEIADILKNYPENGLRIEGHTDSQGDDAKNQALSESRAKVCLDYLAARGIAADRMTSAGFGETRPIADNATKAGRDLNRRVEFNTFVR
jgi:OmpA-OmpF porin, OOP family